MYESTTGWLPWKLAPDRWKRWLGRTQRSDEVPPALGLSIPSLLGCSPGLPKIEPVKRTKRYATRHRDQNEGWAHLFRNERQDTAGARTGENKVPDGWWGPGFAALVQALD